MSVFGGDTHWRNSMKPARFFFLDARAALPFVFCLLHLRLWTLCVAAITTLIFYFLEQRGMDFNAALRGIRVWFVGRKRPNIRLIDRTRMVDFSWEPWPEKFIDKPLEEMENAPEQPAKPATTARRSGTTVAPKVIRKEAPTPTPKTPSKPATRAVPGKSD